MIVGCEDAEAYRHWIADETHWDGEPEVSMLAEIYQVEIIVAVCGDVSTRKMLKYGGGSDRPPSTYSTQANYDPLVGPPPARALQFAPVKRDMAGASARRQLLQIAIDHTHAAAQRRSSAVCLQARCPRPQL